MSDVIIYACPNFNDSQGIHEYYNDILAYPCPNPDAWLFYVC